MMRRVGFGLDLRRVDQPAQHRAVALAPAKPAAGQHLEPHHIRPAGLGAVEPAVVGRQGHAVGKLQPLGDDVRRAVRAQHEDEAVVATVQRLGPGLGMGGVGAPDVAGPVEHRIVGARQPPAADFGQQGLVDAGRRIEPLQRPLLPVIDAEVGDQHPAPQVHVDAVGRPALRTHAGKGSVGMDFGHRALVVGGEDPTVPADHDILGPVDADGDLRERLHRDTRDHAILPLFCSRWRYQNRSGGVPSSTCAMRRRVALVVPTGRSLGSNQSRRRISPRAVAGVGVQRSRR